MDAIERIVLFAESKGISKYKFYKLTGLSNGFLDKGGNVGSDKCAKILSVFPELNPEWLLTGRGSMLKPVELMSTEEMDQHDKEVEQGKWQVFPEKPPIYRSDPRDASMIELQAKQIVLLEEKIHTLEGKNRCLEQQIKCLNKRDFTDVPTAPHYPGAAQVGRDKAPHGAPKSK